MGCTGSSVWSVYVVYIYVVCSVVISTVVVAAGYTIIVLTSENGIKTLWKNSTQKCILQNTWKVSLESDMHLIKIHVISQENNNKRPIGLIAPPFNTIHH